MKWINVNTSLPEDYTYVLVCDPQPSITIARYAVDKWEFLYDDGISAWAGDMTSDIDLDHITYWMPLPSPPED